MKKTSNGSAVIPGRSNAQVEAKIRLVASLLDTDPGKALLIVEDMLNKAPLDARLWIYSGLANQQLGEFQKAEESLNKALILSPNNAKALYSKARLLYTSDRFEEAENFIREGISLLPKKDSGLLKSLLAIVLQKLKKYEDAIAMYDILTAEEPSKWSYWNQLGLIYQELADFEKMDQAYQHAQKLSTDDPLAFFNHIASAHYNPEATTESIRKLCQQWQPAFRPKGKIIRAKAKNLAANKKLRIGMISDGFRSHPVGLMIAVGMYHIPKSQIEFYLYSTNLKQDHITKRVKQIAAKWQVIDVLSDEALDEVIRKDNIDILFDLNGYNANSRMLTMQREPAPVQIKWVGGLISSTGLPAMDYLLSDNIETPEGFDEDYSEKLIRMPSDYICYDPPYYLPSVKEAPVFSNGFITFGCFNNAAKINDNLLEQWALLLGKVPGSRLFLKSFNFSNNNLCERVVKTLERNGISRNRVLFEGASPHKELLESYNKVDIALDPWPYSGGLTTCEAMVMGVPVVTLPGPTFAGRHSASHLVHAGMPELVAENWQQYIDIAVGLTTDLNSLSTIRHHLREILLSSPVCDGKRFAQHFSDAMRAVWQRYCEGKSPEALQILEQGGACFKNDIQPMELQHPIAEKSEGQAHPAGYFSFELPGKVMMLDYGGRLARHPQFKALMATGGVHAIVMDPLGTVEDNYLPLRRDSLQHVQMHLLGDGENKALYMCLDPSYSSDLTALNVEADLNMWVAHKVLAEVPASSSRLDTIEGMESLEWLVMDNTFNLRKTMEYGERTLSSCLVISIWYRFELTHHDQLSFSEISDRLRKLGFAFHSFADIEYSAPKLIEGFEVQKSSKMIAAQMLFTPVSQRISEMTLSQREKLAFILHTGYQLHDAVCELLMAESEGRARAYLGNFCNVFSKPQSSDSQVATETQLEIIPLVPHMSADETRLFERCVQQATHYFEFGSGGSTKLVARQNITVYGVESDKNWVDTLKTETGEHCQVSYVDIGPTKEWGYPVDDTHQHKFPLYSESILEHSQPFDLILVDGRFRVACTLNAILQTLRTQQGESKTKIFIHDFWDRENYHAVLEFLDVVEKVDTAGVFTLKKSINVACVENMLKKYRFIYA